MVPDRMHRPALEDSGEEAGDGPAHEDAGDGVKGVFEVRVVGGEDAAVEQEDAELGATGAEWVDGFEDVEGSAGANGIGRADADDVLPEAVMCACRVDRQHGSQGRRVLECSFHGSETYRRAWR